MVHTYQDVIVTLTRNYAENVLKNGILINTYVSIKDAVRDLGIKYYKIVDACKNETSINGLYFQYA